jgi:hypothetical protein
MKNNVEINQLFNSMNEYARIMYSLTINCDSVDDLRKLFAENEDKINQFHIQLLRFVEDPSYQGYYNEDDLKVFEEILKLQHKYK